MQVHFTFMIQKMLWLGMQWYSIAWLATDIDNLSLALPIYKLGWREAQ